MTVEEAYEALGTLIALGHYEVELVSVDIRSEDTGSVSFGFLNIVDGTEEAGYLLDMEVGTVYLPVVIDH